MTNRDIRALADKEGLLYTIKYGIIVDELVDRDMQDAVTEARDALRRIENKLDSITKSRMGLWGGK